MKQRTYFFPAFIICLLIALVIFILGNFGLLGFLPNGIQRIVFPIDGWVRQRTMQKDTAQVAQLKKENLVLTQKLTHLSQLEQDNTALRDQFQTTYPSQQNLLPVTIVNSNFPETLIIAAGENEHIHTGQIAVFQNNVIGSVTQVASHYSQIQLITSRQSSFAVKDSSTNALGVAKAQGNGEITMGNILLSDTVHTGDLIVTLGNQNLSGLGFPPNLLVGKVVSVEKNPSSLFQEAQLVPLITIDQLTTLFVLKNL